MLIIQGDGWVTEPDTGAGGEVHRDLHQQRVGRVRVGQNVPHHQPSHGPGNYLVIN